MTTKMNSGRRRALAALGVAVAVLPAEAFAQKVVQPKPGAAGEWRLIGQTHADHAADHDVIIVKGPFDNFRRIKFKVTDAPLNMQRMVVTYDSRRTAGMTARDLISALTPVYGAPTAVTRAGENPDFGAGAATWNAADASVELFRGSDAWRLVLTSRARYASARRAASEAMRLDEKEAPARERARQKQDEAAERERLDQNRRDNAAAFQP